MDGPVPKHRWVLALACLPALALILAGAAWTGAWQAAVVALGGAVTVGFGAYKTFTPEPLAPMVTAALGMTCSAVAGSLLGHWPWALALAGALWAACCAWLFAVGDGPWWIVQQWTIALLVAGGFPGDLDQAALRGGLMLAGGLVQLLCFTLVQKALYRSQWRLHTGTFRADFAEVRALFADRFRLGRYGVYAAVVVALCQGLTGLLHITHAYWAPMTALLVLKPRLNDTWTRGKARVAGTLAGCLLASLVALVDSSHGALALACLLFAFGAYALQDGRYSLQTLFITGTTVLMVAMAGVPEREVALERLVGTLVGGGTALLLLILEQLIQRGYAWRRR